MAKVKPPTNFSVIESLNFVWDKLQKFVPNDPHSPIFDEGEWDDICTAMSWIEGGCGVERIEGFLEHKNRESAVGVDNIPTPPIK